MAHVCLQDSDEVCATVLQDPTPHWSVSVVVAGQSTQESGQSIKVEILMEHRREEQLTAFIKSAVDEKADMAGRMAKLESERACLSREGGRGWGRARGQAVMKEGGGEYNRLSVCMLVGEMWWCAGELQKRRRELNDLEAQIR